MQNDNELTGGNKCRERIEENGNSQYSYIGEDVRHERNERL